MSATITQAAFSGIVLLAPVGWHRMSRKRARKAWRMHLRRMVRRMVDYEPVGDEQ